MRLRPPLCPEAPHTLATDGLIGINATGYLAIQPQGGHTTAVVEALVGSIVLHIRLPGGGERVGVRVYIVLLLSLIALKLINDLSACLQVFGTPLCLEHGRDFGVVDMAPVEQMVWVVPCIQRA